MRGAPLAARLAAAMGAALSAWLCAGTSSDARDAPGSLAEEVKAAYLDKLGAFVDWPPSAFGAPNDPARLCVVGEDPFGPLLDQAVRGQRIASHPIVLVRMERIEHGAACHILFAAGSPRQSVADDLEAVRGQPVLTVTDGADGSARGMINFVQMSNRIRFEIDVASATQSGLTISSKLLSLAVKPEG